MVGGSAPDKDRSRQEEAALVARLKKGDERAFAEVVRRYQDRIYSLVYRMVSNPQEAEDVAQDVFISFYTSIDGFRGDCSLSTWLYRIAVNHSRNRLKYLKIRREHRDQSYHEREQRGIEEKSTLAGSSFQAHVPRPDQVAAGRELEGIVARVLDALPADQRSLIVCRDIEGLSYQEMVEIFDLPLGTLKSRLHRARLALKDEVSRHWK